MVFKGVPLSASSAESISRRPQPPSSGELDSASREVGTRSRSFDCKSGVFVSECFEWMLSSRNSELENVLSLWRQEVDLAGTKLAVTIWGSWRSLEVVEPAEGGVRGRMREVIMLLFMEAKSEQPNSSKKAKDLNIEGYPVGGLSIGGHETCIMFPTLKVAFDIGRCPPRAVSQDFLLISHAHMDHIGGLPMYVATRGLYRMKPPTIIVPISVKDDVEKLFEVHRKMDHSELKHNLIGLDVGEEFYLRKDLKVKAFRTYHVIPSQGYILYYVRQKLKPEYIGLSGNEIKNLKSSGVEVSIHYSTVNNLKHVHCCSFNACVGHCVRRKSVMQCITYTLTEPEIAFTGDTMSDFIVDENNTDVLRARILVIECTFVNNSITVEHAKDYGHTHLSEIIGYAERFKNRAILLIHFSARYTVEEIEEAVTGLPPPLAGRTFALTEGF
ncbi:hypothetical protein Ahy_A05g025401 isoform D [Arachis hypogaea]|uniref:Metallo-beta-lactamase domain-containing protein n=1 Tax=Arachis hypogaea TaxID=3818 RepID=A0A445D8L4_ARAHY|nr:hypothetical protein Ahy_A05g025401 isoform D [Arachis hypogaea]